MPTSSAESSKKMAAEDGDTNDEYNHETINPSFATADSQVAAAVVSQIPIRHAGRALVRGKFRRVWRPRHLEVLDNGLVKYYEVPAAAATSPARTLDAFLDNNKSAAARSHNNNSHDNQLPKCTLWIHNARIIDVTTLRDIHVGLPRGSFGFLFNGHQMDEDDNDAALFASRHGQDEDILRDNIQLLTMGQSCQGNTNLATPRDFLCAVHSLEEAQSWVIALQWAASMGRESSFHVATGGSAAPSSSLPYTLPRGASRDESWQEDALSISSSFTNTQQKLHQAQTVSSKRGSTRTRPSTGQHTKKQPSAAKTATTTTTTNDNSAAGKMVVTKVVGYKLVRLEAWKWEIAYQIQVLLVIPAANQRQVQEWSILRTAQDLEDLVVSSSSSSSSSRGSKLKQWTQQIEQVSSLPQVQSTRSQPLSDLSKALSAVDSIMRSFCMEATLVNSSAMKRFLGLHASSTTIAPSFWAFHKPTALVTLRRRTILHQSIDEYVKHWLQSSKQKKQSTSSLGFQFLWWYLRLPQPSTTYAGVMILCMWLSSSILPSWNRFIRKYQVIPFVAVRMDALVLSWCAAAGFGHWLANTGHRRQLPTTPASAAGRPPPGKPTTSLMVPPTSSVKSTATCGGSVSQEERRMLSSHGSKSLVDDADNEELVVDDNGDDDEEDGEEHTEISSKAGKEEATPSMPFLLQQQHDSRVSSPLPEYDHAKKVKESCWTKPKARIFNVRGSTYLRDRVKIPSGKVTFTCQGVDMWMTDNPERHIARHPSVLGGRLATTNQDMFLVNFLLPFGNFVSYFSVPPLDQFATPQLAGVWTRFIQGDQQYRDARLKLLPVVMDGPWIVKAATGTSPALLGKVIPLQYFFTQKANGRSIYEVDVIITASSIAKGILTVVKGHAKALSIAFAFIIEAAEEKELPETVLASFQVNALHLEDCPLLPDCNLDAF